MLDADALTTIYLSPPASGDAGVIINQAIASVTFNGTKPGRVLFLPGTYNITTRVRPVSNLCLQGQPDWSAQFINLNGVAIDGASGGFENLLFKDLYIDNKAPANFWTAISIYSSTRVFIEHCFIDNSVTPPLDAGWTLHAILSDNCDQLYVHHCRTKFGQIKTASTGAGYVEVAYNSCDYPTNFGMSHVAALGLGGGVLREYVNRGNVITNMYGQGGIYTGSDSHTPDATGGSIRVEDNVIGGVWSAIGAVGIRYRPLITCNYVGIKNNVIVNRAPTDVTNGYGIGVIASVRGGNIVLCEIFDNYVQNQNLAGVYVGCQLEQLTLRANRIVDCGAAPIWIQNAHEDFPLRVFTINTLAGSGIVYEGPNIEVLPGGS